MDMSESYYNRCLALRRKVLEKEFERMNDMQREAVFHTQGPLLILAGAGSGKTTVLVNRIANLIQHGDAYHSDWLPDPLEAEDEELLKAALAGDLAPAQSPRLERLLSVRPARPWEISGHHLHQQGGGGAQRPLGRHAGGRGKGYLGHHLPLLLRADSAPLGRPAGLYVAFYHLRHRRLPALDEGVP